MGLPVPTPGADFTFTAADLFTGPVFLNPGADVVATLPTAIEGIDTYIYHVGASHTITVDLPGGTDLMTIIAGGRCHVQTYTDSSGVPQYVTFQAYTLTNVSADRAFDADSTSTAELADVLGTLIADLKVRGLID